MIFSDLPSPAEAASHTTDRAKGFAQAGNRYPLFGIMLCALVARMERRRISTPGNAGSNPAESAKCRVGWANARARSLTRYKWQRAFAHASRAPHDRRSPLVRRVGKIAQPLMPNATSQQAILPTLRAPARSCGRVAQLEEQGRPKAQVRSSSLRAITNGTSQFYSRVWAIGWSPGPQPDARGFDSSSPHHSAARTNSPSSASG